MIKISRALVSVSDKSNIFNVPFTLEKEVQLFLQAEQQTILKKNNIPSH